MSDSTEAGPLSSFDRLREQRDLLQLRVNQLEVDSMSGLLRREVGIERMARICQRHRCCVVLVDIDNLKAHNDVDFSQGDWAIQVAARATVQACRGNDLAIRWGGDEMVLCLPSAGIGTARRVAQRIQQAAKIESAGRVSVSCGWALQELSDNLRFGEREILRAIDEASRQAGAEKRRRRAALAGAIHVVPADQATAADATLLARSEVLLGEATGLAAGGPCDPARAVDLLAQLAALCADMAAVFRVKARLDLGGAP